MNWFQIVSLCEESQACLSQYLHCTRCELISNCIFMWGITSVLLIYLSHHLLWIDFKLYLYVRNHKFKLEPLHMANVVNWFQIVSLCEESQEKGTKENHYKSCELISNCIFMWGITSIIKHLSYLERLWIDFKLYLYVRNHKGWKETSSTRQVVNWFQIVSLCEESQEMMMV